MLFEKPFEDAKLFPINMQSDSCRWGPGRTGAVSASALRSEICRNSLHRGLMIRKLSSSRLEIKQSIEFEVICAHCSFWAVVHGLESLNNPEKVGRSEPFPLPYRDISRAR